jgi:hypothetical protein
VRANSLGFDDSTRLAQKSGRLLKSAVYSFTIIFQQCSNAEVGGFMAGKVLFGPPVSSGLRLMLKIAAAWALPAAILVILALLDPIRPVQGADLTALFLNQDRVVLAAAASFWLIFIALCLAFINAQRWGPTAAPPPLVFAGIVAVVAVVGWRLVCHQYPLSLDEFMAGFDAVAFAHGHLLTPVAASWRGFLHALQPTFLFIAPRDAAWSSAYLPVNALVLAVFDSLKLAGLMSALWAGIALIALAGVARRLWPDRPDVAAVCLVLLASSNQFLVTAMTPYAMSAHLALNLVWLWLFLGDRRGGDVAAVCVAFAACGLHQFIFHPLFAAPFIVNLWTRRRRKRALAYTLSYGAILCFWLGYWQLLLHVDRLAAAGADMDHGAVGPVGLLDRLRLLSGRRDANTTPLMLANLIRFVSWQNPVAVALAVLALPKAIRSGGIFSSLVIGPLLMVVLVYFILPWQGHGWGYRYLHGFLGSVCLLAGAAWVRLTSPANDGVYRAAWTTIWVAFAFCIFCLLPWRAVQVSRFIGPFAAARAAMMHSSADVLLVDPTGVFFGGDLVRNDPLLRDRPKIMDLSFLDEAQVRRLCARGDVAVFDRLDAARFGMRLTAAEPDPEVRRLRQLIGALGCVRP